MAEIKKGDLNKFINQLRKENSVNIYKVGMAYTIESKDGVGQITVRQRYRYPNYSISIADGVWEDGDPVWKSTSLEKIKNIVNKQFISSRGTGNTSTGKTKKGM